MNLTNENKEIYRKYYYDLYDLELDNAGEFDKKKHDDVKRFIDYKIEKYLQCGSIQSFSNYICSNNCFIKRCPIKHFFPNKEEQLVRSGAKKSIDNIVRYYQIKLELEIRLNNPELENIEQIIINVNEDVRRYLENYFSMNTYSEVTKYTNQLMLPKIFSNYNIKSGKYEIDILSKIKNGKLDNKELLYNSFVNKFMKLINYNGILSEEQLRNLAMVYFKDKTEHYLENENNLESTLVIYMASSISRLASYANNEEIILIRYNKYFKDMKKETIDHLLSKYSYILEEKLKNVNSPVKAVKLKNEFKKLIEQYLEERLKIIPSSSPSSIKNKFDYVTKNIVKNKESNFDLNLARNSNFEDKKNEEAILLKEFSYLISYVKVKHTFYTDEETVLKKLNESIRKIIHGYINGTCDKTPAVYINTRLEQVSKQFEESLKRKFKKDEQEYLFAKRCVSVIKNYIDNNNLEGEELTDFISYARNVFNTYISNGSFPCDVKTYMIKALINYNDLDREITKVIKHHK